MEEHADGTQKATCMQSHAAGLVWSMNNLIAAVTPQHQCSK